MLFVGLDAGGSGTRAVLVDAAGRLLASGHSGASGTVGGIASRRALQHALSDALAPLVATIQTSACTLHLGMRGLSVAGRREAALDTLQRCLPGARVGISNDARIALHGALGGGPGVGVLAGTGSIAVAHAADGREGRSGGYGGILSDEGSAYWLGREALAACLRAIDGRGPATALAPALAEVIGGMTPEAIVSWLYRVRDPVPRLAALAPRVTGTAAAGDALAGDIVDRAAAALAELATSAAHQVWAAHVPPGIQVARCGGVWSAGAVLEAPFAARLAERLPGVKAVTARLPPTGGAVLLAMAASGYTLDAATVARLEAELATSASRSSWCGS